MSTVPKRSFGICWLQNKVCPPGNKSPFVKAVVTSHYIYSSFHVKLQNRIQLPINFAFSEFGEHLVRPSGTLVRRVIFLSKIKKKIRLKFSAIYPASRLWCIILVDIICLLAFRSSCPGKFSINNYYAVYNK